MLVKLVMKILTFCGTGCFIATFTSTCQWNLLSKLNPIHNITPSSVSKLAGVGVNWIPLAQDRAL